jgi:hypothetical protein
MVTARRVTVRRRALVLAPTPALVLALALLMAGGPALARPVAPAAAPVPGGCAAAPGACGFPAAADTGVPAGTTLLAVPGQVSSGQGWSYSAADREVEVTGGKAVLSGLLIPFTVNITASHVTLKDVAIVSAASFGVSLRHTAGVTIEDSTISGLNATTGRVGSAIDDIYGDSTGTVIADNNISAFKTAVQISAGLITGNDIHDPGFLTGDHTNGIFVNGTNQPLMIYYNTILINLGQTDAVNLDSAAIGAPVANKSIEYNLVAGGSYTLYGGDSHGSVTSHIVIDDNWFSNAYYPAGGKYGPGAYFATGGTGNAWSGNIWADSGRPVPAPSP